MKSLHIVPEIPLLVIYDRATEKVETYVTTMECIREMKILCEQTLKMNTGLGSLPKRRGAK